MPADKGRDGNQTWWICLRDADCSLTEVRAQVIHEAREKGGCFGFGIAELDRNFGGQMRDGRSVRRTAGTPKVNGHPWFMPL
jgi:hypothetical protein